MPPLIIIWALVAAGISLFGAFELHRRLSKKRFAILGATGTGKTTLHNFLTTGEISKEYLSTKVEEKTKGGRLKLEGFKLQIKSGTDIQGTEEWRKTRWEKIIEEADYVCYIISSDLIYNDDDLYLRKIESHINSILEIMEKQNKPKQKLYVLNSYCDKIAEYKADFENFHKKMNNKLYKVQKSKTVNFFGSMSDKEEAKIFVGKLIGKILE